MRYQISSLCIRFRNPILLEEGQNLVEYALLVALLSLGAVTAVQTLASEVQSGFIRLATLFNS